MLNQTNQINNKKHTSYLIIITIIFSEFINSMLRYFSVIDMGQGVTIRKALFLVLFAIMLWRVLKIGSSDSLTIRIRNEYLSFLVMYLYFLVIYVLRKGGMNITEISNIIMPFVVGILGYLSRIPQNKIAFRVFLGVYLIVLSYMYLVYVRYGQYNYTPVGLNSIYYIILAYPLVFIEKEKKYRLIFSIPIILMAIISLKTTAILIIFACTLVFFLFGSKHFGVKVIFLPIVGLALLFLGYYIADRYFSLNIFEIYYRQNLVDGGNGRTLIWSRVIDAFSNSSLFSQVFGHGYNDGIVFSFGEAHNDFLETLYDYGIIGLLLMIINICYLVRMGVKMYKVNYEYTVAYIMLTVEILIMFMCSNSLFVASYFMVVAYTLFVLLKDFDESKGYVVNI